MEVYGINSIWPDWEVVHLIGRGSYGAVYEIERSVCGYVEKAAMKVISIPRDESDIDELRNEGFTEEGITERYEQYLKSIVEEYAHMADVKGHPNIVSCDDISVRRHPDGIGWDVFIRMELLTPLTKTLKDGITEEQIIRLGKDISNALAFCAQHNVIQRDIKPRSIFVAPDGTFKLNLDVNIETTEPERLGACQYFAPEVYRGKPYRESTMVYSLGILLYWLLNDGQMPFLPLPPAIPSFCMEEEALRRRFLGEPIPPPAKGSEMLKRIVLKACAYDPNDRFQSAEDLFKAIASIEPHWTRENERGIVHQESVYFDHDGNEVEKEQAVHGIIRGYDFDGNQRTLSDIFYVDSEQNEATWDKATHAFIHEYDSDGRLVQEVIMVREPTSVSEEKPDRRNDNKRSQKRKGPRIFSWLFPKASG